MLTVNDWVSANFPWLLDFLPWLVAIKDSFHTIEGLVLIFGLFWIVSRLKRERKRIAALIQELGNQVETVEQQALAAREAAESIPVAVGVQPQFGSTGDEWDEIRSEWQVVRERIELAIKRISHKSVRGKYAKIPRYNYRDVIVALRADNEIKSQVETALLNMNQRFLTLRSRPASATQGDVEEFREWHRLVNGSLPKPLAKAAPTCSDTPAELLAAE